MSRTSSDRPFHPYTYELLMAVPSINRASQPRLLPRADRGRNGHNGMRLCGPLSVAVWRHLRAAGAAMARGHTAPWHALPHPAARAHCARPERPRASERRAGLARQSPKRMCMPSRRTQSYPKGRGPDRRRRRAGDRQFNGGHRWRRIIYAGAGTDRFDRSGCGICGNSMARPSSPG